MQQVLPMALFNFAGIPEVVIDYWFFNLQQSKTWKLYYWLVITSTIIKVWVWKDVLQPLRNLGSLKQY